VRVPIALLIVAAVAVSMAAPQLATATAAARHAAVEQAPPRLQPSDITPALRKYRKYVHGKITALVPAVHRLHARLVDHDVRAAKGAWLTARLIWLRIGQDNKAYGIFGDLGQRIDGTADGLERGVHDSKFTGFHRIERDLWRRHDVAAARADAAYLVKAVDRLSHLSLAAAAPDGLDGATGFILRSHEVIEDAVRDTLSGDDEYGSGTGLASVVADVQATRKVVTLLAPLIRPRAHKLVARARDRLSRLVAEARTGRHHGQWTPVRSLPRRQRQSINAAAGAADEILAPIPTLLRIDSN